LRAGGGRRSRHCADEGNVGGSDLGLHRHQDVGEGQPGDDVDFVLVEEFRHGAHRDFWLLLVVFAQHGGGRAAELATQLFQREAEAVVLVAADFRGWARESADKPDLDVGQRGRQSAGQHERGYRFLHCFHCCLLLIVFIFSGDGGL
jgi:hypothetical protein